MFVPRTEATFGVSVLAVVAALASCTATSSLSTVDTVGGGPIGEPSSSGELDKPSGRAPPAPPEIACTEDDADAGDAGSPADDGGDAGGDAGAQQAACPPPPPVCETPTTLLEYVPDGCASGLCRFKMNRIACAGGCFQALDGTYRCND